MVEHTEVWVGAGYAKGYIYGVDLCTGNVMQRTPRLIKMADMINKGRCPTVQDFCLMFEVAARTVHEDIRELREGMACRSSGTSSKAVMSTPTPRVNCPSSTSMKGKSLR